jgi:hypothetical protein
LIDKYSEILKKTEMWPILKYPREEASHSIGFWEATAKWMEKGNSK